MRFCNDFPKMSKLLRFDAECLIFSKLDLSKGYFQIRMRKEDRCKTAFTTRQYQFVVMPFGLKTAGAVFSRIMRLVLEPLNLDGVQNFMDDILAVIATWCEHVDALEKLIMRLDEVNLSICPTKCALGFEEVGFLGHKISAGQMKPEEDKLMKIQDAPRPLNKKQVRAFMGLAGYYRRFISNYAAIARPLTDLTQKKSPDQCQNMFDSLKEKLGSTPI